MRFVEEERKMRVRVVLGILYDRVIVDNEK